MSPENQQQVTHLPPDPPKPHVLLLEAIQKKIRLSKMPASISLKARGFQQVLICGEWEGWSLQNLHFQSCSHAASVRTPVFSRFGQKVILISGKLLI